MIAWSLVSFSLSCRSTISLDLASSSSDLDADLAEASSDLSRSASLSRSRRSDISFLRSSCGI